MGNMGNMSYGKNAQGVTELNEGVLEKVSGGYLQVSKWREYATQNILPSLILQRDTADASDKTILDRFYSTIQGTLVPGASVVAPIKNLRSEYYNSTRSTVHSASVRQTLDNAINMACNYLDANA